MKLLDEISVNDAIEMYYEKHHAIRQGDMNKLLALKNKCPEIFYPENDEQIHAIIEYVKTFQRSSHYKELLRQDIKKKLSIVKNGN